VNLIKQTYITVFIQFSSFKIRKLLFSARRRRLRDGGVVAGLCQLQISDFANFNRKSKTLFWTGKN
jgi:hypothetical protein